MVYSALLTIIVLTVPLLVIAYVAPYQLHCAPKSPQRTDQVPLWCLQTVPSVYGHIQTQYWQNTLFGFLYRPLHHMLTALPMFMLLYFCIWKAI